VHLLHRFPRTRTGRVGNNRASPCPSRMILVDLDLDLDLDLDRELADRILSGLRRHGYATPIASPDANDRTSDTGLHQ
jgi:hypothetical protein